MMKATRELGPARPNFDPDARIAWCVLTLALIVGLLRFVRFSYWSLWLDETLTYTDWYVGIKGGDIHNPIGYWLIAWVVRLQGGEPDEFALRILPTIAGYLCVPLTWLAFRRFAGELRASGAALLVAASSWHVYWSQNARFYTMAQACSLIGTWLCVTGFTRGSSLRALLGLVGIAAGAAFHPSVALLLPAIVIAPLILIIMRAPIDKASRAVARHSLLVGLFVALIGAKWAWAAWSTYLANKSLYWSGSGWLETIIHSYAHYAKTTGFYVSPVLAASAAVGAWFAWLHRERQVLFIAVVVLACLTGGLVAASFVRVSAQYVFFLVPWIMVLACAPLGGSASRSPFNSQAARLAYLALLFLPTLITTVLYLTTRQGERPQWRDAYQYIQEHRREGDLICAVHASVGEYYLSPGVTNLREPKQVTWLDYYHPYDPTASISASGRTWFVVNPEEFLAWRVEDAERLKRALREECRLVIAYPLYVESRDLSVWIYLRE